MVFLSYSGISSILSSSNLFFFVFGPKTRTLNPAIKANIAKVMNDHVYPDIAATPADKAMGKRI